jgi:hypothetical protein
MNSKILFSVLTLWCLCARTSLASNTYTQLNIADRRDYAFGADGIFYITTTSGNILRYDTQTGSYLSPFALGGALGGIDLSPDGLTLAVADFSTQGTNNRIHLVNTTTGINTPVSFTRQSLESGTFMVAWGADNQVLVTSNFAGSGNVPLRRYNPLTNITTSLGNVRQSSMLTPSADRNTIGIAEANSSAGPITDFDVPTQTRQGTVNTGWFAFEVAVDRDGDKFVVPTYNGAYVYNKVGNSFVQQGKLGQYANHGPIAAVFSPTKDLFFTAEWGFSAGAPLGVRAYDANTLGLIGTIDPYHFDWNGNSSMGSGRMEISPDGRMLAVSVNGGVRLYNVSAIPEPSTIALLMTGSALGLWSIHRRRRKTE